MAKLTDVGNQSSMQATLQAGYNTLDGDAKIAFYKYTRYVLPVDGYIFWVKDLAAAPLYVDGSLHYSTDQEQREDETIGINRVILTTVDQVQNFNAISASSIYIGEIDAIRFAFTSSGKFYQQAGIYHYVGDAIYPAMKSQIIDNPVLPISIPQVATNSLPIWLALNTFTSAIPHPTLWATLYPSFLLPTNLTPPYFSVDINETAAIASTTEIDKTTASYQLMREKVKITAYGMGNDKVIDFLNFVLHYSLNYDTIGIINMPRILDEKRTQSELGILAMKKSIEFEVSYYQSRSNDIARQLITQCLPNFIFN